MSHEIKHDEHTGTELTPHEWDGLEELNTPLPRWWMGIFFITIFWAIIYMFFMPAIPALPGMQGYTKGKLGWSDRARAAEDDHDLAGVDVEIEVFKERATIG